MSDFKTVYPGQYSPREEKILDETRKKLQEQIGKPTMFPVTPADPTLMRLSANAWDPWNPLFHDDEYAKNTKYGSIIAIPCWKEPGAMFPMLPMDFGDKLQRANDGGAFIMYAPIYPGDTFTTVCDDMIVEDLTPPEGSEGRYMRLEGRGSLYNERGELVMSGITRGHNVFSSTTRTIIPVPRVHCWAAVLAVPAERCQRCIIRRFIITPRRTGSLSPTCGIRNTFAAQIPCIGRTFQVGDHPTPICSGPWTEMDMIKGHGLQITRGQQPLRDIIKTKEGRRKECSPLPMIMASTILTPLPTIAHRNQPGGRAMFYNTTGRNMLIRLLTNYMGDDGFLRYIDWHFMSDDGMPDSFLAQVPEVAGRCRGPSRYVLRLHHWQGLCDQKICQ